MSKILFTIIVAFIIGECALNGIKRFSGDRIIVSHGGPLAICDTNVNDSRNGDHKSQKQFRRNFEMKAILWFVAGVILWFAAGLNVIWRGACGYCVSRSNWVVSFVGMLIGIVCIWHGMRALDTAVLGTESATVFCGSYCASAPTYGAC
jgi:hypothetical protein